MSVDIEKRVRDILAASMGCPVLFEVPDKRPEAFATVELTDDASEMRGIFHVARLAVTCWGATRAEARALADAVMDETWLLQDAVGIMEASALSAYRDPDPDTGAPRYTVTLQIRYSV